MVLEKRVLMVFFTLIAKLLERRCKFPIHTKNFHLMIDFYLI